MKKNNFVEGMMVATIGIVLCKILGLLYVIPFYSIIGTKGGALYSYAYSIYSIFLSLSISGIPTAISKIISEYNELGYTKTKEKIYKIASKLINLIGGVSFLILFFFSNTIAKLIIGNITGGNTVEQVSIAIKLVSLALLIVPRLSLMRGYLQGHKYITPTSIAEIVEQLVRVIVIVMGSYITVKVLNLSIETAVYVAILGASIGALISYLYLKFKTKKYSVENIDEIKEEEKFTSKYLLKQIIFYALPFVIIDLLKSAYSIVDSVTVVKTLVNIGYDVTIAETAFGVMSTWGTKLNMIVISISLGLTVSLVPNIASSMAKKDYKDVNTKINQSLKILLYTTIPMAVGISFLATPVWNVFYGYNELSISIFRVFILQVVFFSLYTTVINLAQSMSETKIALGSLVCSFLAKALLNIPMMYIVKYCGIESYFGPTITNAIVECVTMIIVLKLLKKKYNFSYKETYKVLFKVILSIFVMLICLCVVNLIVNISNTTRLLSIINIVIYSIVGASVYVILTNKLGLIKDIFGDKFINKIKNKLLNRK